MQDLEVDPCGFYHDNVNSNRLHPGAVEKELMEQRQGMKVANHLEGIEEENLFHLTMQIDSLASLLESVH